MGKNTTIGGRLLYSDVLASATHQDLSSKKRIPKTSKIAGEQVIFDLWALIRKLKMYKHYCRVLTENIYTAHRGCLLI